jgi:hypothetical protein
LFLARCFARLAGIAIDVAGTSPVVACDGLWIAVPIVQHEGRIVDRRFHSSSMFELLTAAQFFGSGRLNRSG